MGMRRQLTRSSPSAPRSTLMQRTSRIATTRHGLVTVLAVVVLACASVRPSGRLVVTVIDRANGGVVSGVQLLLTDRAGRKYASVTGQDGVTTFENLGAGEYRIVVQFSDVEPYPNHVAISSGETVLKLQVSVPADVVITGGAA